MVDILGNNWGCLLFDRLGSVLLGLQKGGPNGRIELSKDHVSRQFHIILPESPGRWKMIIPPTMKPENVKRLVEIGNRLYIMEIADRLTREEQDERRALIAEREKIRRGR